MPHSGDINPNKMFPQGAEVSNESRPILVLSIVCALISEIENVRQGCARFLIRQMGKKIEKPDGWKKLWTILKENGFEFENSHLSLAKWWKMKSDGIANEKPELSDKSQIRGMIQRGAIDRVVSLEPNISINKLAFSNGSEAVFPIKYIDDRLKELDNFVANFVGWVKSNGFLPKFPTI
jgi:hypothetical protein